MLSLYLGEIVCVFGILSLFKYLVVRPQTDEKVLSALLAGFREQNLHFQSNFAEMMKKIQIVDYTPMFHEAELQAKSISKSVSEMRESVNLLGAMTNKGLANTQVVIDIMKENYQRDRDFVLREFIKLHESLNSLSQRRASMSSIKADFMKEVLMKINSMLNRELPSNREKEICDVLNSVYPVPKILSALRYPEQDLVVEIIERLKRMEKILAEFEENGIPSRLDKLEFSVVEMKNALECDLYNYCVKHVPILINLHKAAEEVTNRKVIRGRKMQYANML